MKKYLISMLICLTTHAYPPSGVFDAVNQDFQTTLSVQNYIYDLIISLSRCCPIGIYQEDINDGTYTITQQGRYVVREDLTAMQNETVIVIDTNNVTLDLKGYTIDGNAVAPVIIAVNEGVQNVTIKNGTLTNPASGPGTAINVNGSLANPVQEIHMENLNATNCASSGYSLSYASDFTLVACNASAINIGVYVDGSVSYGIVRGASFDALATLNASFRGIQVEGGAQCLAMWCEATATGLGGTASVNSNASMVSVANNTSPYTSTIGAPFYGYYTLNNAFPGSGSLMSPSLSSGASQNCIAQNS